MWEGSGKRLVVFYKMFDEQVKLSVSEYALSTVPFRAFSRSRIVCLNDSIVCAGDKSSDSLRRIRAKSTGLN